MQIATKERPIRCSKLAELIKCSMKVYLLDRQSDEDEEGGPAAQTGSLTHAGVAEFHRLQEESLDTRKKGAWDALAKHAPLFPLADQTEVRLFITPYMNDPRNIYAKCLAVEEEINFTLPPHKLDPTESPIYVKGHFDQIRLVNERPLVYDLKTGKKTGWEMIHDYAIQLAAYTYGAKQDPRFNLIQPGYIIRNYGYRSRNATLPEAEDVFWKMPFQTERQIEWILENVRLHVALYRLGEINFGPGPHCTYCELGGLTGCTHKFGELQDEQSNSQPLVQLNVRV